MADQSPRRNLVFRADGKMVNVPRKQGQLFVCATGCCCGHTDRGFAAVPEELYHNEWERRRLRNRVHLTIGGCLGPCTLANVAMLLFDGHATWFHSINSEAAVLALYDYIDQMLAADAYLPPPPALATSHFTAFTWEDRPDGQVVDDAHRRRPAPAAAVAPSGFLYLTHADTDLIALDAVAGRLPADFPPVRAYNLLNLKSDADVDAFLDAALPVAEVVIVRLHGGRASFAHGLDRLAADAAARGTWLLALPGPNALDPELTALCTVGVPVAHEAFAYLQFGGLPNHEHLLRFLADHLLATGFGYDAPAPQPRHGIYRPAGAGGDTQGQGDETLDSWRTRQDLARPTVGVLFYRSHMLSGNTDFVDALVRAGEQAGMNVLPVYAYSLKDDEEESGAGSQEPAAIGENGRSALTLQGLGTGSREKAVPAALRYFLAADGRPTVDVIICTMAFAMGGVNPDGPTMSGWAIDVLERLDVPVVQAITAGSSRAAWEASLRGLSPVDAAMNVVLPEFDGRILTVPVSFKEERPHPSAPRPAGATPHRLARRGGERSTSYRK